VCAVTTRLVAHVSEEVAQAVLSLAAAERRSVSQWLGIAIERALEGEEPQATAHRGTRTATIPAATSLGAPVPTPSSPSSARVREVAPPLKPFKPDWKGKR